MMLDVGHSGVICVPVYKGHIIQHGIRRSNVGGGNVTEYLMKILLKRGYLFMYVHFVVLLTLAIFFFRTWADRDAVREIKEQLCYAALDFEQEMSSAAFSSTLEKIFQLPDGQVITISHKRFRCVEPLFQPSFLGMEGVGGIHELVYESIMAIDASLMTLMLENIVLAGGSSIIPGIADRLVKEITSFAPATMQVRVVAPPERRYSAWIGGSKLCSHSTFQSAWMSKEQYDGRHYYFLEITQHLTLSRKWTNRNPNVF